MEYCTDNDVLDSHFQEDEIHADGKKGTFRLSFKSESWF